jgi:hypothetical protein
MKISIALAALIALAPLAAPLALSAESNAPEAISDDMITAAYALSNISDEALDLATQYSRAAGIQGTTAGSYLANLIADTNALKHAAQRLSIALEDGASAEDIQHELTIIEVKYQAVYRGSSKVSTQLYSQMKTLEGYQLRAAYNKIRSRYVYLQARLAE